MRVRFSTFMLQIKFQKLIAIKADRHFSVARGHGQRNPILLIKTSLKFLYILNEA